MRDAAPDLVVDASGPFQAYGDDPYVVVKACLALNIDYIDLADSSRFVDDIVAFDDEAKLGLVVRYQGWLELRAPTL